MRRSVAPWGVGAWMCGLGLLSALGCVGTSRSPVRAREAAVEVVPSAAPATAPPPTLVVQTVPTFQTVSMNAPRFAFALSPGGGLMATVGPVLKVLSTADGRVWADFGRCVRNVMFLSDHELLVIACPEKPAERPERTAVSSILRWDLRDLTVKPFAQGPFESASLSADGERVVVWGDHAVQVLRLNDGGVMSRITRDESKPGKILRVSVEGDRAVAVVEKAFVSLLPDGSVKVLPDFDSESDCGQLSPDLRRRAHLERGKLVLRDAESGATLSETLVGPGAKELSFDRRSEQLAVYAERGDTSSVRVVAKSGRLGCIASLERLALGDVHWSTSNTFALEEQEQGAERSARLVVFDAATCRRSRRSEPYPASWAAVRNDALSLVSSTSEQATFVSAVDDRRAVVTATPVQKLLEVSREGALRLTGPESPGFFDPRREALVNEPPKDKPAIKVGGATLSIAMADGRVVTISDRLVVGKGSLFLQAESGARTVLAGSNAFVPDDELAIGILYRCSSDAGHRFVACSGLSKEPDVDQRVAVWDERGRKLFEQSGTYVTFSADGSRALIRSNATAKDYLVETRTGRELASRESIIPGFVGFDRSGAWVAWSALGLLDAGSGKVVALEGRLFGGWLSGQEPSLAVVRSERFPDPWDTWTPDFGPLDVYDVRQGKVTMSFASDAAIVQQKAERVVTRDAENVYRVRDAQSLVELHSFHSDRVAGLSADGGFVHYQVGEAIVTRRLSDGEEILQVPPRSVGERGLTYTSRGLYDGDEKSPLVLYRVGAVVGGKLLSEGDAGRLGHRPGLAADFFAGKDLKVAQ